MIADSADLIERGELMARARSWLTKHREQLAIKIAQLEHCECDSVERISRELRQLEQILAEMPPEPAGSRRARYVPPLEGLTRTSGCSMNREAC